MHRYAHPPRWSELLYCAPYYIYFPEPDRLQIWVKPRYWFFAATVIVYLSWLAAMILPNEVVNNVLAPILGSKQGDFRFWLPLSIIPITIALIIIVAIYKRQGLLEISADGIVIIDNPRFMPMSKTFLRRESIAGFDDVDLYTNVGKFTRIRSGTEFRVLLKNGSSVGLMKIWGVDSLNKRDFNALKKEILTAFERTAPAKTARRGRVSATDDPSLSEAENQLKTQKRRTYRFWEMAFILLAAALVISLAHANLYANNEERSVANRLPLLSSFALAFVHMVWIIWAKGYVSLWRLCIPLLVFGLIAWPTPLIWKFVRESEIRNGISTYATVTDIRTILIRANYAYEVEIEYHYGGKAYHGHGKEGSYQRPGKKIPLLIGESFHGIYDLHTPYWRDPEKPR